MALPSCASTASRPPWAWAWSRLAGWVSSAWLRCLHFGARVLPGRILRTLAIWGQLYDAQQAYLQVMQNNPAAQQLYAKAGFATAYHYHYREKRPQ